MSASPATARLWPLAALGFGFMAYTAWNQSYWWIALEENRFGWLTPFFVAFVLWDRRFQILQAWNACAAEGSPRAAGVGRLILQALAISAFTVGLLAFLAGALYRAGAGPSLKGTTILSAGIVAILLTLPWFAAPRPHQASPSPPRADARVKLCLLLLFPAAVWLLSSPLVTVIEGYASVDLLRPIVASVSFIFEMLGLPIGREGNILIMPDHGQVGVEEACSGIRSITGCLFAGGFLGAIFLTRFWQKVTLIISSVAFALIMNWVRALFLAVWAFRHGTASIEGAVHDSAGYAVLAVTAAALFGFASVLARIGNRT